MTTWPAPTHDTVKAKTARAVSPGFSYCLRCGLPWRFVDGHTTEYTEHQACFPLCEGCWTILGCAEARIPYYAALLDVWEQDKPVESETRRAIGLAVAAGL